MDVHMALHSEVRKESRKGRIAVESTYKESTLKI